MGFWSKVSEGKNYRLVNSPKLVSWLFNTLKGVELCAIDTETSHRTALPMAGQHDVVVGGISFSWQKNQGAYLPLYTGRGYETWWKRDDVFNAIIDKLEDFLAGPCEKVGQNVKFDGMWLYRNFGIVTKNIVFDTMLAHHLLDEEGRLTCRHGLKPMAKYYLDPEADRYEKELKSALQHYDPVHKRYTEVDLDILYPYACSDTDYTLQLMHIFEPQLEAEGLLDLFYDVVMPLQHVCMLAEIGGMEIDLDRTEELSQHYTQRREELKPLIYQTSGFQFDIASPQQVAEVLYNRLGLPVQYGKKGQVSTDKEALARLEGRHPVIEYLHEYRSVDKLYTGYVDGVRKRIDPETGRLHPTFLIHGTVTGRLSCVASWTEIQTQRGLVPISEVVEGDLVWTHRGRWRRVLKKILKGPGRMYDIRLSNGYVLTCTIDHRLLLSDGTTWVRVEELVNESFNEVGRCCQQSASGACDVPWFRCADGCADRQAAENESQQRGPCVEKSHGRGRAQGVGEAALLAVEKGQQEPDEGQDRRESSQLGRGVRGRRGVLDGSAQRQTGEGPPSCDGSSVGVGDVTRRRRCASHRRRSEEQFAGQPCCYDTSGSSNFALFAGKGCCAVTVTGVEYRGVFEVHDLTVEEDSSYLTCGTYSHNSEDPNVQNWPRPEHGGIMVKSMFVAPPDHKIVMADYSQAELRVAAHCSREPAWLSAFRTGADIHAQTAIACYGLDCTPDEVKKLYKEYRSLAKTINFGIIYGMSEFGLAPKLNMEVDEARAFIDNYFSKLPVLDQWIKDTHALAIEQGYVVNPFGRRRRLPDIQLTLLPFLSRPSNSPSCWGRRKEAPPIIPTYYPDFAPETHMGIFGDSGRMQGLASDLGMRKPQYRKCAQCPLIASCVYELERGFRQGKVNEAKRQSVNSIVQSGASDLTTNSYAQVLLTCKQQGIPIVVDTSRPGIRPWDIIHDEICYIVHDMYVEQVGKIIVDVMMNIFPECLVPMEVDLEIVSRLSDKHEEH